MDLTQDEWKQKLTPEQYHVLREKGTEHPGSGTLLNNDETGMYTCAGCGSELFKSDSRYESTLAGLAGWPSFSDPTSNDAVIMQDDNTLGMHRTEVICKTCGGHLGHFFPDESSPNGDHFCINSAALEFLKKD